MFIRLRNDNKIDMIQKGMGIRKIIFNERERKKKRQQMKMEEKINKT